jgi:curved DNA-binding protein CbpA
MPSYTKTLYELLQVNRLANKKEIKTKFYELSKKCHPDLNPNDKQAHARFIAISEAYATLSDPIKRREYDKTLTTITPQTQQKVYYRRRADHFPQDWSHSHQGFNFEAHQKGHYERDIWRAHRFYDYYYGKEPKKKETRIFFKLGLFIACILIFPDFFT